MHTSVFCTHFVLSTTKESFPKHSGPMNRKFENKPMYKIGNKRLFLLFLIDWLIYYILIFGYKNPLIVLIKNKRCKKEKRTFYLFCFFFLSWSLQHLGSFTFLIWNVLYIGNFPNVQKYSKLNLSAPWKYPQDRNS